MDNEISKQERILAGIILIIFTCLPAILIIRFWPDRLPGPKEFIKPLYYSDPFHVRLADICDTNSFANTTAFVINNEKENPHENALSEAKRYEPGKSVVAKDSADTLTKTLDTSAITKVTSKNTETMQMQKCITGVDERKFIHINSLLLILVALAGFLGNMIHIATSFTNFIGAKQFVRSWLLWYCVKPFSASALAIAIYFVFRGGFLNMSDESANINLYGVMTISLLTGLFTDRATQKLKEVFEVLFRPREERPNTLDEGPRIMVITPTNIEAGKENTLTLTGENLNQQITAFINEDPVPITNISKSAATIKYTIPDAQKDKTDFVVTIKDKNRNVVSTQNLHLKKENEINSPANKTPDIGTNDSEDDSGENGPGDGRVDKE